VYLRNSVAAMPASAPAELAMLDLRREILDMPGSAVVLSCEVLVGDTDISTAFQPADASDPQAGCDDAGFRPLA
jgi:hypothetical protein